MRMKPDMQLGKHDPSKKSCIKDRNHALGNGFGSPSALYYMRGLIGFLALAFKRVLAPVSLYS